MAVSDQSKPNSGVGLMPPLMAAATEYLTDTWQRSILYADIMRQRGNQYQRHMAKKAPNVLSMKAELVMYGHDLPRPVNYVLTRFAFGDLSYDESLRSLNLFTREVMPRFAKEAALA